MTGSVASPGGTAIRSEISVDQEVLAGGSLHVECRLSRNDLRPMFPSPSECARVHLVAVDIGAMKHQHIEPQMGLHHKPVSQTFFCCKPVKLKHCRKQQVRLTPDKLYFHDGRACLALQIVREGSAVCQGVWVVIGSAVIVTVETQETRFLQHEMRRVLNQLRSAAHDGIRTAAQRLVSAEESNLSSAISRIGATSQLGLAKQVGQEIEQLAGQDEELLLLLRSTPGSQRFLSSLHKFLRMQQEISSWQSLRCAMEDCRYDPIVLISQTLLDQATHNWMSSCAVQKGGSVAVGLDICLSWACGDEVTNLDMCMTCPACGTEVREDEPECRCVDADGETTARTLMMDVTDTGTENDISVEQLIVKDASAGVYPLSVIKYSGPPVPFVVTVAQFGRLLATYHSTSHDEGPVKICQVESNGEGIVNLTGNAMLHL